MSKVGYFWLLPVDLILLTSLALADFRKKTRILHLLLPLHPPHTRNLELRRDWNTMDFIWFHGKSEKTYLLLRNNLLDILLPRFHKLHFQFPPPELRFQMTLYFSTNTTFNKWNLVDYSNRNGGFSFDDKILHFASKFLRICGRKAGKKSLDPKGPKFSQCCQQSKLINCT